MIDERTSSHGHDFKDVLLRKFDGSLETDNEQEYGKVAEENFLFVEFLRVLLISAYYYSLYY